MSYKSKYDYNQIWIKMLNKITTKSKLKVSQEVQSLKQFDQK